MPHLIGLKTCGSVTFAYTFTQQIHTIYSLLSLNNSNRHNQWLLLTYIGLLEVQVCSKSALHFSTLLEVSSMKFVWARLRAIYVFIYSFISPLLGQTYYSSRLNKDFLSGFSKYDRNFVITFIKNFTTNTWISFQFSQSASINFDNTSPKNSENTKLLCCIAVGTGK